MIFNMFSWKKIAANKKEFSLIHNIYKNLTANMTLSGDAEVFPSKRESCSVMSNSLWPHGLISPWNSPGQNTGVGCLSLLQGIFPTQGLNPGLLHCRRILYQLSHKGSPSSTEKMPLVLHPGCEKKKKTLQTLSNVYWGAQMAPVDNYWFSAKQSSLTRVYWLDGCKCYWWLTNWSLILPK